MHWQQQQQQLTYAFADATVAEGKCDHRKSITEAHILTMNSKALGADMTYAWENAEIGMMDARLAAKIMYDGELMQL